MKYETEEDVDDAFERIEEINLQHTYLKEAVEEARENLAYAERELRDFQEDNASLLI